MKPILIDFGFIKVYSYGFFLALAFLFGIFIAVRLASEKGIKKEEVYDLAIIVLLSGIFGARISYVLYNWELFAGNLVSAFYLWEGGLTIFGGLLGGIIAGSIWVYFKKYRWLEVADIFGFALPGAIVVGRLGCFFNGCCYGVPTECPVSVVFPALGDNIRRFPTQLFESFYALLIFVILWILKDKFLFPGDAFFSFIGLYGLFRFFNEFIRVNPPFLFNLSGSQWLSLLSIFVAIMYFIIQYGGKRTEQQKKKNN